MSRASADANEKNAPSVKLRPSSADDIGAVAEIEKACFGDPWSAREFESVLQAGHTIFLVAEIEGTCEIAGYVVAMSVLDEGEILNVAVAPELTGKGLGGTLLDAALTELRRREAVSVFLEVRTSNEAARSLYASRGFIEVSRRKSYYRSPVEDALVLRRAVIG